MIKEGYKITVRETSLNISQSHVDSVRRKEIVKSGCRVYADGFIGIAGTLGEATDKTWAEAEANLALKIPYPFEPEKNVQRTRDLREMDMSDEVFIRDVEDLLAEFRAQFPDFVFSNKIAVSETEVSLQNDAGLAFLNRDKTLNLSLIVKHKDSINIFDTGIMLQGRTWDREALLREAREMLVNFGQAGVLPAAEKVLVVLSQDQLMGKILESLNGENIARGASLFCGKMGTQVFGSGFTVYQDRTGENRHVPFFDAEGVTHPDDQCRIVSEGVLTRAFSDKKTGVLLGLPSTGAASGAYDETPALSGIPFSIAPGEKTLKELLDGEKAMVVIMASGGDYTTKGDFASPVQLSMLTDGEHLLSKLPECSISGNLYDIFGADFVGVSSDKPWMGERALVVRMRVTP